MGSLKRSPATVVVIGLGSTVLARAVWLAGQEGAGPARTGQAGEAERLAEGLDDHRDFVLTWFEDEELGHEGRHVALITVFGDPLTGPGFVGVRVRGTTGHLVWVGDPGVGELALEWRDRPGPCGAYLTADRTS